MEAALPCVELPCQPGHQRHWLDRQAVLQMCLALTPEPNPHQTPEGRQRALDIIFRDFKHKRPELYKETLVNGEMVAFINMEVPTKAMSTVGDDTSEANE